ncbi:hypothetical protein [Rhodovastum atsumiense]|uniref:Uncharacterized protein n=1 Tax=Rhodovastum atsumiense TaxID=504468 RepID=A0A5M6IV19_9PROT|nr:hypothetical protein [Rhodovastum atsumiense]KAA5612071.1 hypothetical protein F1189_11475 [Rhodovastum atsumiense]
MIRLLVVLVLCAVPAAQARPPENPDPELAPWYNSLRQPGTGISCCSIADCRPVDYRVVQDRYEAFIAGAWRAVPPDRVLHREDNPTGRAVVCWTPTAGIMCFVKGPEI